MEKKPSVKYRGVRPATLVKVCEGNGTDEYPYEEVEYVTVYEQVGGRLRPITLGRVVGTENYPIQDF